MNHTLTPEFKSSHSKWRTKPASLLNSGQAPTISIITPFYNTPPEIFTQTVQCILNQSFADFEWILVDDASTNTDSLLALQAAAAQDQRIIILNNTVNSGPSAARNNGIKKSRGSFLFFIDSDDLLEPLAIEKFWLFLSINSEFSFCNSWHIGFGAEQYLWAKGFEHKIGILYENVIQPTFLARRSLFNHLSFDESIKEGFEDWDFWLQCAVNGHWGYTIPEYLYWYRRTASTVEKWKNWDNGPKMNAFKEMLKNKYEKRLKAYFPSPAIKNFTRGIDVIKDIFPNQDIVKDNIDKKRILFIFPWLSMGGADKFNLEAVKGLTEKNWQTSIITTQRSDNLWNTEFLPYTSDILHLPNISNECYFTQIIEQFIKSRQPDCILISNSEIGYYLSPYIKMKFPAIPLFDYNHMEESYWNNGGHPRQSIIYQSLFESNLVSSNHLKKWMTKQGAEADKIKVIYTGSDHKHLKKDLNVRKQLRESWGVDDDLCIIMFSGRLTHQKQPFVLLGAIAELSKTITSGFVLIIAGDGPNMSIYEKWAEQNNLIGKIWFMGPLSNEQNLKVMQASDIFFLPSLWEGISLAIYEAMTLELPIVGANVGGQIELVSQECGTLIKTSSPENEIKMYASVLRSLIEYPEKRKQAGINGRKKIEESFGLEATITQLDAALCAKLSDNSKNASIEETLRQTYALLFFEKKLADDLWHQNSTLKESSNKNSSLLSVENKDAKSADWYYIHYETLPFWYKKVGHVLKIINGKKDFRSIFSKKFRPDPLKLSHNEWYVLEYEALPNWYKRVGRYIRKKAV